MSGVTTRGGGEIRPILSRVRTGIPWHNISSVQQIPHLQLHNNSANKKIHFSGTGSIYGLLIQTRTIIRPSIGNPGYSETKPAVWKTHSLAVRQVTLCESLRLRYAQPSTPYRIHSPPNFSPCLQGLVVQ